jgi:hypothetical protein
MPLDAERRNKLLQLLPEGIVTSRHWLMAQGWEPVAYGVYKRPFGTVTWQGLLFSLQSIFELDVVAGGLTALGLQGYGQYMPLSEQQRVDVYTSQLLPTWIEGVVKSTTFILHSNKEWLGRSKTVAELAELQKFTKDYQWKTDAVPVKISMPERAILEVLSQVPEKISFDHARELIQGMSSLSPRKLQVLLETCQNRKVVRLFCWMAEMQDYPWFKKLDISRLNMGTGKRVLLKGGKWNAKYQITVPQIITI